MTAQNREGWLTELARRIQEQVFRDFTVPKYRVTCGFPSKNALNVKRRRVGECHAPTVSSDGTHEILISLVLDKPVEVGGVLCHEMAHSVAGIKAHHGKDFTAVCRHVGITADKPASAMPGEYINKQLTTWTEELGPYPHKAMTPAHAAKTTTPRQKSVKLGCRCGCLISIQPDILSEFGPPLCACGSGPMQNIDA